MKISEFIQIVLCIIFEISKLHIILTENFIIMSTLTERKSFVSIISITSIIRYYKQIC